MRYTLAENGWIIAKFNTGDAVTISLYDLSTGNVVALSSNTANEIGATGIFRWNTSDIQVTPVVFTEYLWIMNNGTFNQYGKIVLGGYVDNVDQALSTTESNIRGADGDDLKDISDEIASLNDPSAADVADAVWNESKAGHTGDLKTMADNLDQSLSATEDNIRGSDNDDLKDISDEIAALNNPSSADIADAVWNESKAGHTGDLKTIADNVDQSLSTTESNIRGTDNDDLKDISDEIATSEANIRGADNDDLKDISDEIATSEANIRGADSDDLTILSDQIDDIPTLSADAVWDEMRAGHLTAGSFGKALHNLFLIGKGRWKRTGTQWILYDSDDATPLYTFELKKADGTAAGENNPAYERVPA